jgi:predicted MFS family arabinose efflux permease
MQQERAPAVGNRKRAFQLIILFGLVSLFGDIIYEGARSVNGPYLKTMGASAVAVGFIAGIGEFLGYAIRLISGYFVDKTKAYWFFTVIGYGMLVSVPLLSLAGVWQIAALFIVAERIGKAFRAPARDTIVSQASKQVGTGFGFGLNEAMDQIGAIAGPLIFTALFFFGQAGQKTVSDYQLGYGLLWIPLVVLMCCIALAYRTVPNPQALEESLSKAKEPEKLSKVFWLYTFFSFVATAGFVNFVLLGYHFKARHILSDAQIPLFYAVAMGIDGITAVIIGKLYDVFKQRNRNERAGLFTLIVIPVLSAFIPLCAFSSHFTMVIVSVILWGVVMGAHETIMKSAIADLTPLKKRGTGYGIFNTSYGLAMLAGSSIMGILYERSLPLLITVAVIIEVLSIPLFFTLYKEAVKRQ